MNGLKRRNFLSGIVIGGVVAIAGCSDNNGNGDDTDGGTPEPEPRDDNGNGEPESNDPVDNDDPADDDQEETVQGNGVIIVPEENDYRNQYQFNFQNLNEQHPIFQNTDHTDEPQLELGVDTAPRIFHQEHIEGWENSSEASYLTEVSDNLYDENIPEEVATDAVNFPYIDWTGSEYNTINDLDYNLLMNADTEQEALGIIHPLVWNAEDELRGEAPSVVHGRPLVQLFGVEHIMNNHPNEDLGIRISNMHMDQGPRGIAYCESEDSIRLIETSSGRDSQIRGEDPQMHPEIQNSWYIFEHPNYDMSQALDRDTQFDYENLDALTSDEKRLLTGQIYNFAANDMLGSASRKRGFDLSTLGFEEGNVAITPGLVKDFRKSILEYNESNNSVDFEEDVLTLSNTVETIAREHSEDYFVVDYAPGNEYDGELNGDYKVDIVDEDVFEEVRTDTEGVTNHFFE